MAEGFKVLQVAVDDRNFQEGLITALPRSGLLEPSVAADGALSPPLNRVVENITAKSTLKNDVLVTAKQ